MQNSKSFTILATQIGHKSIFVKRAEFFVLLTMTRGSTIDTDRIVAFRWQRRFKGRSTLLRSTYIAYLMWK